MLSLNHTNFLRYFPRGLLLVQAILLLTSCAAFDTDDSATIEQSLMTAGFEVVTAQTPEETATLENLPQNVLQPHERQGKRMFVYADAENCRCAFWGDKAAYDRYQKLSEQASTQPEKPDPASRIDPWSQGPWWVY